MSRLLDSLFPFWKASVGALIPHPVGCECPRDVWHWIIRVKPASFDRLVAWHREL